MIVVRLLGSCWLCLMAIVTPEDDQVTQRCLVASCAIVLEVPTMEISRSVRWSWRKKGRHGKLISR